MASRHQPGVRWTRGWPASPLFRERKDTGGEPSLGIKRVLRSARVWVVVTASLYTGRGVLRLVPIYHPSHSSRSSCFLLFFFPFPFSSSLFPSSLCLPLSRIGPLTARLGVDGAWAWRSYKNGDTFPRIVVKVKDVWVSSVKCKFKKNFNSDLIDKQGGCVLV